MNPDALLFVYGSLRSESAHPLARKLTAQAKRIDSAKVHGRLLDLGAYPGLWTDPECEDWVFGELLELPGGPQDPKARALWAELDAYEELAPPPPALPEYARERLLVTIASGLEEVWTYRYIGATEGHPVVTSGNWLAYLASRGR